jgi:hypothetical protein
MANVKLSERELNLVCNADIILTKNNIITKLYDLFGVLSEYYTQEGNIYLNDELKMHSPKISRGENYEGLPWLMLDYPRYFKQDNVCAIRVFFWWGNFISITLQLKGKYRQQFNIENVLPKTGDWFLCCNENEWQQHFREDNYKLLNEFSDSEIQKLPFIKLAVKIPLSDFDDAEQFLKNHYLQLIRFIKKAIE